MTAVCARAAGSSSTASENALRQHGRSSGAAKCAWPTCAWPPAFAVNGVSPAALPIFCSKDAVPLLHGCARRRNSSNVTNGMDPPPLAHAEANPELHRPDLRLPSATTASSRPDRAEDAGGLLPTTRPFREKFWPRSSASNKEKFAQYVKQRQWHHRRTRMPYSTYRPSACMSTSVSC